MGVLNLKMPRVTAAYWDWDQRCWVVTIEGNRVGVGHGMLLSWAFTGALVDYWFNGRFERGGNDV